MSNGVGKFKRNLILIESLELPWIENRTYLSVASESNDVPTNLSSAFNKPAHCFSCWMPFASNGGTHVITDDLAAAPVTDVDTPKLFTWWSAIELPPKILPLDEFECWLPAACSIRFSNVFHDVAEFSLCLSLCNWLIGVIVEMDLVSRSFLLINCCVYSNRPPTSSLTCRPIWRACILRKRRIIKSQSRIIFSRFFSISLIISCVRDSRDMLVVETSSKPEKMRTNWMRKKILRNFIVIISYQYS